MSDPVLTDKVTDLEVQIAFLERAVRTLDDVVRGLSDRIDTLDKELASMRAAVAPASDGPAGELPPHY